MGQFTPSYQPGFTNYTQNDSFSVGSGETPLGSGDPQTPPSTSGFNGASLVQTNGNPLGGVYSQPGKFGNPAAPPPQNQSQFGNPGWKPTYSAPGGYNPLQYASDNTANELAQGLGGTVDRTKTLGPFGDFGQNQITFGNGNQLNAGLLADRFSKYDSATANAMTDAEKNAGPAVTNPNAGAVYLTGNPMINPSQTPGYHPPGATAQNPATPATQNPLLGGPGSEPQVTGPQPGAQGQQPGGGNQQNQLMQLLQLLGMGGQARQQNRQPYANSGYYPNLPRGGNQMNPLTPPGQFSVSQVINSGNAPGRSNVGAAPTYNGTPDRGAYRDASGASVNSYTPAELAANQAHRAANPLTPWSPEMLAQAQRESAMMPMLTNGSEMSSGQNQNSLPQQNIQRQLLSLLLGF